MWAGDGDDTVRGLGSDLAVADEVGDDGADLDGNDRNDYQEAGLADLHEATLCHCLTAG